MLLDPLTLEILRISPSCLSELGPRGHATSPQPVAVRKATAHCHYPGAPGQRYLSVYTCLSICMYINIYTYTVEYQQECIYVYVYMYMYICIYIHIYVYIYICMYIYIHMYTLTHTEAISMKFVLIRMHYYTVVICNYGSNIE